MNKMPLLIALGLLLIFLSCEQPDQEEEVYNFPTPRIKTMISYTFEGTPQTFHFTYDAQGRIVETTYEPGGVKTYRYLADTMIVALTHKNETLIHIDSLWLNDQGLAVRDKNWEKSASPLGGAYTYTYTYEYNAEGYLIQSTRGDAAYEIQDGNTVKQIHYTRSDPWDETIDEVNYTTTYRFIPNSINTIGFENQGVAFYGKQNKNLVDETKGSTANELNPFQALNTYTYQLDARKRVVKEYGTNSRLLAEYNYYN